MNKIRLCPEIEEVFADNIEDCRRHFKPLVSIDYSEIGIDREGSLFLVYFNDDPYCEETVPFLNDDCDEEKVTFEVFDGKYKFKTDFGYFLTNEDWVEWLEMGNKSYAELKEKLQNENLDPLKYVKNLNGSPVWAQSDATPMNSNNEPMKFVCQMTSYELINDMCGEEIFLFYDENDNVAVQVHQVD